MLINTLSNFRLTLWKNHRIDYACMEKRDLLQLYDTILKEMGDASVELERDIQLKQANKKDVEVSLKKFKEVKEQQSKRLAKVEEKLVKMSGKLQQSNIRNANKKIKRRDDEIAKLSKETQSMSHNVECIDSTVAELKTEKLALPKKDMAADCVAVKRTTMLYTMRYWH